MDEHTMFNCGSEVSKFYCEEFYPDNCANCPGWTPEKSITNADRIRAMTDEELAEWLASYSGYGESAWLGWLKEVVEL